MRKEAIVAVLEVLREQGVVYREVVDSDTRTSVFVLWPTVGSKHEINLGTQNLLRFGGGEAVLSEGSPLQWSYESGVGEVEVSMWGHSNLVQFPLCDPDVALKIAEWAYEHVA